MRLAIADPPYLGRANRWYGDGRASGSGRHKPDTHPDARCWDDPATHLQLLAQLVAEFDGWAIAATPSSLRWYLPAAPTDVDVLAWHRRNAPPSGARLIASWEPVIVYVPPTRRARDDGVHVRDVLDAASPRVGFTGSKPSSWTHWVLAALGHDPATDTVTDLFPGSGAVSRAANALRLV